MPIRLAAIVIELDAEWPAFVKSAGRFFANAFSFDVGTMASPECTVSDEVAQAHDGAHQIFLYKVSTDRTMFSSIVHLIAESELAVRQFAITHGAFIATVAVLLVVALLQYGIQRWWRTDTRTDQPEADMRSFRHMRNTINAVRSLGCGAFSSKRLDRAA